MTSEKLNEEHAILRRFMAVVVSSAFRKSLTKGHKLSAPKSQIASNMKSQSPNRRNSPQIAVF